MKKKVWCWKKMGRKSAVMTDPSLRVRDSEEDTIVVSDNEEEVEAPPSSE